VSVGIGTVGLKCPAGLRIPRDDAEGDLLAARRRCEPAERPAPALLEDSDWIGQVGVCSNNLALGLSPCCYRPYSLLRIGSITAGLNGESAGQDEGRSHWLKGQKAVERQHEMLTKPLRFQG
jgi:hypothetical protein